MEDIRSSSNQKSKSWIIWIIVAIVTFAIAIGFYIWVVVLEHAPGMIRDGVLYLNQEEIYVYSSLDSALADTKGEDGPPKTLKEILPEILAEEKLVYLEGTTVGICIDKQITEEEIPDAETKEDRVVYKIGNYFLAESMPGE